jgi:DNA-binding Lrp family transcriptional regulator
MGGFLNMTRTQQEAFSKMVGISADDIIDMIYKRQEMAAIQKAHAQQMAIFEEEKNRLLALGIDISNEEEFMEKYGISERYAMLVELGASDTEIKKRLMTMVTTAKEEESAAEKFQRAIGILKDKFVRFVGDGEALDLIVTRLTDFINSKAVRYLMGTSDKDLINGILEADIDENQGKIMATEIERALQNANEDQEVYYDPLTGNITYIDKIDPRSQELRDQLSSLLDPKTGAYALIDEMYLGGGKGTISPLESTEMGRIENLLFLLSGFEYGQMGYLSTQNVDTSDPGVTIIGKNKNLFREIDETFEMRKNTSEEFAKNRSAALNALPPELRAMAQTGELQSILQDILFQYAMENRQEFMNAGQSIVEQGFINVTDIQLENNKLTEQALRNQMDSETLNAGFELLENRILYSLSAEATGQAESLSENNQLMLKMFLKNYGGSDEDIRHMKEIMRGDNEKFGVDTRTRGILDEQNFNMQKGKIDFQKYTSQEYEADKQKNLTNVAKIGGGITLGLVGGPLGSLALMVGGAAEYAHSKLNDFIQTPGQIPQAFQKGELNTGGNTPSNDPIIQLLEKLVISLEQQPDKVDLDANVIGIGISTTSTSIGTTVR